MLLLLLLKKLKKHTPQTNNHKDKMNFNYEVQKGKKCCSSQTITFHYVEWAETLALHKTIQYILQHNNNNNNKQPISNDELQSFVIQHWPTNKKDIGGYSHNLPPLSRKDVWDDLLFVLKHITPKTSFEPC